MTMMSVTYAEALIACFDAKYHYASWRPITAIRAGFTDGDEDTVGAPTWSPVLPGTPNHPEYPSAHSCSTPAGGVVVARFLGTGNIDFTVPSLTGLGDRHFDQVKALEYEVSNAPHLGWHQCTAVENGVTIGKKTVHQVLAHHFQRSPQAISRAGRSSRAPRCDEFRRWSGVSDHTSPQRGEIYV